MAGCGRSSTRRGIKMKLLKHNWLVASFIVGASLIVAVLIAGAFPNPTMPIFVGNYYGDGTGITNVPVSSTNGGTVTSVGLSLPAGLSVAGSPVTVAGTLAVTAANTAGLWGNNGSGVTSWSPLSGIITSSGFVTSFGTF